MASGKRDFSFTDEDGDRLDVDFWTTGEALISVVPKEGKVAGALLSNKQAKDLRNILIARYPHD